jgi:hypothetical protein
MKGVYRWLPQQDWNQDWTDETLYKKCLFRQMCGRFPSSRLIFCECSGMDLSSLLS